MFSCPLRVHMAASKFKIDAFVQELDRSISKQTVRTLWMHAANVILELRCTVNRKGLIEKVPCVDPLSVREIRRLRKPSMSAKSHR